MFNCFENHRAFEPLAEKRLIYKGGKEKPDPEKLASQTEANLQKLRRAVGSKPSAPPKRGYHTENRDTTELVMPPPRYKEEKAMEETLRISPKFLEAPEVEQIEKYHQALYEQYLNPAFQLYLNKLYKDKKSESNEKTKVNEALELIFKHPWDFEYVNTGNQRTEIRKRKPYKIRNAQNQEADRNAAIPNDFLVVMETEVGHVTQAGGVNLKDKQGDIPWMKHPEYQGRMRDYRLRFNIELVLNRRKDLVREAKTKPAGSEERRRLMIQAYTEAFQGISGEMQELYTLDNVEIPQRFMALVDSRTLTYPFEKTDPRVIDLQNRWPQQGRNYKDLTEGRFETPSKHQIFVVADPSEPGLYMIITLSYMESGNSLYNAEPLRIDKHGFIQADNGEGKSPRWTIDPRYVEALQRQYYPQGSPQRNALPEAKKKDLEANESRIGDTRAAQQRIEEENRRRAENRTKHEEAMRELPKINPALEKAKIEKLKEIMKAIPVEKLKSYTLTKIAERNANIDKMNKNQLLKAIKATMEDENGDGTEIYKVKEMLGISG